MTDDGQQMRAQHEGQATAAKSAWLRAAHLNGDGAGGAALAQRKVQRARLVIVLIDIG